MRHHSNRAYEPLVQPVAKEPSANLSHHGGHGHHRDDKGSGCQRHLQAVHQVRDEVHHDCANHQQGAAMAKGDEPECTRANRLTYGEVPRSEFVDREALVAALGSGPPSGRMP